MNKILKISCAALGLFLVFGTNTVKLSAETKTSEDIAQDFQELTDAVNGLSKDSTLEEIQEVQKLLDEMNLETQEEGNELSGSMIGDLELSSQSSMSEIFDKIQQQLIRPASAKAQEELDKIQVKQNDAKMCADYVNQARNLQLQAKELGSSEMPSDMKAYFQEKGLSYNTGKNDDFCTANQWEDNIQSLQSYQGNLGAEIQMQMVFLQDYIGQYTAYAQGVNSAKNSLGSVSKGQTMLGGSSTGLMVTVGLGGIVVGVVGTLLVVRLQNKKKENL